MLRHAVVQKEVGQQPHHVLRAYPSRAHRGQAIPGVFSEHIQNPKRPPILRPLRDEVVRPDMVTMGRSQEDTGTIGRPQPGPLGRLGRDLEPFLPPNRLHAILPHVPALPW
jgi:hypothetical protein